MAIARFIRVFDMHDCCIKVTALLEYFKWTLNYTTYQGVCFFMHFFYILPMPRGLGGGRLLVLSGYYGSIIKGCIPHTQSLLVTIKGRGHRGSRYSCNQN